MNACTLVEADYSDAEKDQAERIGAGRPGGHAWL
jgi:hypothetical protein